MSTKTNLLSPDVFFKLKMLATKNRFRSALCSGSRWGELTTLPQTSYSRLGRAHPLSIPLPHVSISALVSPQHNFQLRLYIR